MIKRFFKDEKGVTAVKEGILVALIAVVIIVAVSLLGDMLSSFFASVASDLIESKVSYRNEFW